MSYLGQELPKTDTEIFRSIYQTAQQYFPEKTAQFDKFIQEQVSKYGIEYAKIKAEIGTAKLLRNPLFWLGVGLLGARLIRR